jgi:hypothetical protein
LWSGGAERERESAEALRDGLDAESASPTAAQSDC